MDANAATPAKKRKATAVPAQSPSASSVEDDAEIRFSAVKKSKRAAAARDESEFVSVEVGLRELQKRMASANDKNRAKKPRAMDTKVTKTVDKAAVKRPRKKAESVPPNVKDIETPTPTVKRRATAASKKKAALETENNTAPTQKTTVKVVKTKTPSPLEQARVDAMQQQQQRVEARLQTLQKSPVVTASSSPQQRPCASPAVVVQQEQEPASQPSQPTSTSDQTESSQGFIDEDMDEDLAFLQALEEVERGLGATPSTDAASGAPALEPVPVSVTEEVSMPPPDLPLQAPLTTPGIPMELLAEYERLKQENETLRRSNEQLKAEKSTVVDSESTASTTDDDGTLAVDASPSRSPQCSAAQQSGQIMSASPSSQTLAAHIMPPPDPLVEDTILSTCAIEINANQSPVEAASETDHGDGDETGGVDGDVDADMAESESEEENHDEGLPSQTHTSTIDRGNYFLDRNDQELEEKEEEEEDDEEAHAPPPLPKSAVRSPATAPVLPTPVATSPPRMRGPPIVDDDSQTETDDDHRAPNRLHSSSSSSSSSSSDSEEETSPGRSDGNVLDAALRAATGRLQSTPTIKPVPTTTSNIPAIAIKQETSPPKARNLQPPKPKPTAKRRRVATPSLSPKDLLWPALDAFYDFVLDLTPRRVQTSTPEHLQLLRAYEKAKTKLPAQYTSIGQYCDMQREAIIMELLASLRNAEEMALFNSSKAKLWLTSVSPCGSGGAASAVAASSSSLASSTLNTNVIFLESGFSGKSVQGKPDVIVTFQDHRSAAAPRSILGDFASGDLVALRSPQWKNADVYVFGIVLCSSMVAVGDGGGASSSGGGSSASASSSSPPDQLCVLLRAPPATEEHPDAPSHFSTVLEMCLVNQRSPQWTWTLEPVHNLTTSAREYQAVQSVRGLAAETQEMLLSGLIPEAIKSETTTANKLSAPLLASLEAKHNASQVQAILGSVSDASAISIIQGPPGTGKTKTILGVLNALLDGAALSTARQAQVKARVRVGASLQQQKTPSSSSKAEAASVAQTSIRILVAAPSNAAVDELIVRVIAEGLFDAREGKTFRPRLVRVGRPEALHQTSSSSSFSTSTDITRKKKWRKYASEVEEVLLENLVAKHKSAFATARLARQTLIQNAQLVFCTLSGAGSVGMCELHSQRFDALVIDEAAQAVEASLLIPFKFLPSRVVLVGDHRQLPATVIAKRLLALGYDRSLFQRLVENGSRVFLLEQQYRMHPEISWFPSTYFYHGRLVEAPQMKDWTARKYHQDKLFRPFVFFDVLSGQQSHVEGSKSLRNLGEIDCILALLTRLVVEEFPELEWRRKIGIIAPYKQQIHELRHELQRWERKHDKKLELEVNTVDGFQGREKEVIIYSCVRTGRGGRAARAQTSDPFWADERRMNVAITRAKSSLWIIGNATLLQQSAAWKALIQHAKDSRRYVEEVELPLAKPREDKRDHSRSATTDDRRPRARDRSRSRSRSRSRGAARRR